ncbi:MAG: AraC family transcriptional regulator [Lachnospiraceae bacterium]|nr:AraC family transcriptional regulator [Lachnospiraceae bacterium]
MQIQEDSQEAYTYNFISGSPITTFSAGLTFPTGPFEYYRKVSDCYGFEYVYEGKMIIYQDNQEFTVEEGDFFILHPGKAHHYFSDSKHPCKKIWFSVDINLDFISHLMSDYKLTSAKIIKGVNSPMHMEEILNLARHHPVGLKRSLEFTIHQQIAELSDHYYNTTNHEEIPIAEQIQYYFNDHIHESITLDELCDYAGLGKTRLIAIFKQVYGVTPMSYFMNMKIEFAKSALKQSTLPISDISYQYGFYDSQYFSKVFKKYTGMSPMEYRRKLRQ